LKEGGGSAKKDPRKRKRDSSTGAEKRRVPEDKILINPGRSKTEKAFTTKKKKDSLALEKKDKRFRNWVRLDVRYFKRIGEQSKREDPKPIGARSKKRTQSGLGRVEQWRFWGKGKTMRPNGREYNSRRRTGKENQKLRLRRFPCQGQARGEAPQFQKQKKPR